MGSIVAQRGRAGKMANVLADVLSGGHRTCNSRSVHVPTTLSRLERMHDAWMREGLVVMLYFPLSNKTSQYKERNATRGAWQ